MKPTPTPWGYDLGHTIAQIDGDEWGESVCQLPVGTHDRAPTAQEKADMSLIVQAVNHHAELVEALRTISCLRMADNWDEIRKLVPMWRGVPQNNVGVFVEKAADVLAKLAP